MAGIETPEYQVNVSQENLINKFAVQGEENSRVLTLHLVETVQTVTALEETVIRQKPLDLTGCTARLYTKKPDGNATFTDGTIVETGADGNPNTVTFVLSQQTLAAAGNAHCTVLITSPENTALKAIGITIDIAASDMEQTIVSTSEFASLAEALNKAESAERIAEDSAAEVNQTVSAASTELQSLKTQSSDITTAETARVDAEGKRVTAESDRVTAEGKRQTAETARSDAEAQRTSNESTRQITETARATAESSRASEESKRATAETSRTDAEQARQTAESGRQTAEAARADAEGKRTSAETARSEAEDKRATAEQGRVDAESARVTAEQARQAAESSRQTAETARESASQTAVNSANAAATRANAAAKAAEGVVQGDIGTAVDQRITAKTDVTGGIAGYDSMQTALAGKASATHVAETVSSETGVHGLRWYDKKLQAKNGDNWDDISTGGGSSGLAPADVSGLAATASDKQVIIVWSDPADSVIEGVTVSKWAGSKLVRKEGAYPTNVTDGVLLVDNKTRDTYKTTGYADTGLTNGTTYYYAIFPYSDTGAVNKDEANCVSAVPTTYPLPACTGISAAAGNGQITICWSDSTDVAGKVTWAGSKLVRKEGSYPSAVTDGTLLIDNTTRDHYKTTGYVDTGLTNGTTYYYMIFPYSTTSDITVNTANRVSAVPQAYVKYGVRWHKKQSSPALERLYDSADFTFSATNGATAGHSDFDDKLIYKDIKICNVVNRTPTAYEGEAGFTRDGTNGDVMLEIPKFYYQVTDTADYRDFVISDGPLDGFLVAPRHAPCTDYPNGLEKIYVGVYEASSRYKSISGREPLVNLTRAQFRSGFTSRGAGYCQADWATQFELMILFIIETASLDSQSIVGRGNTGAPAAINTGGSDSVTGLTGSSNISSTSVAVKWHGFENLWGNVDEWRDGINFNDGLTYVCTNPSKYADDTATNYTKLAYSKIKNDGFISSLGLDASIPWAQLPTGVAGSDSTYLCDHYYHYSGWKMALVGGSWGDGSAAGLFCLSSSYNLSYFNPDVGSRLLILPES